MMKMNQVYIIQHRDYVNKISYHGITFTTRGDRVPSFPHIANDTTIHDHIIMLAWVTSTMNSQSVNDAAGSEDLKAS